MYNMWINKNTVFAPKRFDFNCSGYCNILAPFDIACNSMFSFTLDITARLCFFLYWMIQYLWLQLQVNITPIRHEPIIRTIVFFSSVNRNNLDILYSKKGNVFGINHRKVLKMAVLFPRALWANLHAWHWHQIGCKNNTKWPAINWNTRGKLAWCQYSCVQSPLCTMVIAKFGACSCLMLELMYSCRGLLLTVTGMDK